MVSIPASDPRLSSIHNLVTLGLLLSLVCPARLSYSDPLSEKERSQAFVAAFLEATAIAEQRIAQAQGDTQVADDQSLTNLNLNSSLVQTKIDQSIYSHLIVEFSVSQEGEVQVNLSAVEDLTDGLDQSEPPLRKPTTATGESSVFDGESGIKLPLKSATRRFQGDRVFLIDGTAFIEVVGIGPIPAGMIGGSQSNSRGMALRAAEAFGLARLVGILQGRNVSATTELELQPTGFNYKEEMSNAANGEASQWRVVSRVFDTELQVGIVRIRASISQP